MSETVILEGVEHPVPVEALETFRAGLASVLENGGRAKAPAPKARKAPAKAKAPKAAPVVERVGSSAPRQVIGRYEFVPGKAPETAGGSLVREARWATEANARTWLLKNLRAGVLANAWLGGRSLLPVVERERAAAAKAEAKEAAKV